MQDPTHAQNIDERRVLAVPATTADARAIEDLLRAILRDAACGHLGSDLRSTADEILLADGLAVGEGAAGQRGGAEEWELLEQEDGEPTEPEPLESQELVEEPIEPPPVAFEEADGVGAASGRITR